MKLRTVLIIAVLVVAAYKFIPSAAKSLDAKLGRAAGGDEASEPARDVARSELALVHGRVESADADVVVIRCTPADEYKAHRTGEAANRMEFDAYGPLMQMDGDRLIQASWRPARKASGVVKLEGYPHDASLKQGAGVNVIAAPVSAERFTMRYKDRQADVPATPRPGSWMWDGQAGPLDKKAK